MHFEKILYFLALISIAGFSGISACSAITGTNDSNYCCGGPDMAWNSYGSWFQILLMIFIWMLIIAGIAMLVSMLIAALRSGKSSADKSAMKILRRRYVNGEISREEFEQKKRDIV